MHLEPWRWDPREGRLGRTEKFEGRFARVEIWQQEPDAVTVGWDPRGSITEAEVLGRVRRWLSADWEPSPAIIALPDLAALIERGGGRLLRGSSFYEDFVKTVLTINTSWSATCRMAAALVAEPGGGGFPGPVALLGYGERRLRDQAKLGFRAPTVIAATRQMLDDGAITPAGEGIPERLEHAYLIGLKGIGPYAAAHCRVLLHDFARIPVDSSVITYLRERFGCDPAAFAEERASWGDYLALGYRLSRLQEKLKQAREAGQSEMSGGNAPGSIPNSDRAAVIQPRN